MARELVAILDTPAGDRVIAKSSDPALLARATTDELIGMQVEVRGNTIEAGGDGATASATE